MLLKGKTAVITGCMQGIGMKTMDAFAREGADIFACCQKPNDDFSNHIEELMKKYGVEIKPVYFDFSSDEEIKAAAREIIKEKKPITTLVNIAGITKDALFTMATREQMERIFNINFFSQVIFTQYIVRSMMKTGNGSIINTASITATDGNVGQLVYGASKAAWVSATKTMSEEFGPKGIRVNAIAPGVIDTAMNKAVPAEVIEEKVSRSALKRMGQPDEVADVIIYLASDLSSFVTGQIIRIDGGIG